MSAENREITFPHNYFDTPLSKSDFTNRYAHLMYKQKCKGKIAEIVFCFSIVALICLVCILININCYIENGTFFQSDFKSMGPKANVIASTYPLAEIVMFIFVIAWGIVIFSIIIPGLVLDSYIEDKSIWKKRFISFFSNAGKYDKLFVEFKDTYLTCFSITPKTGYISTDKIAYQTLNNGTKTLTANDVRNVIIGNDLVVVKPVWSKKPSEDIIFYAPDLSSEDSNFIKRLWEHRQNEKEHN